jgi:hypothetical protein
MIKYVTIQIKAYLYDMTVIKIQTINIPIYLKQNKHR